ncbi:MAG: sigma-70 family RNA polymerase sigma factor [Actinomycetota bacterium]
MTHSVARHERRAPRDVVADALRDERSNLEAFVAARVRRDEADDIIQLAALRAMERADALDDPARVVAWLYRIHRNLIIDTYRQRARERRYVETVDEVPDGAAAPADDPCDCSVAQAKRLTPNYAAILSLVDSDGLRLSEAAHRLQVTVNNATVRLHRARKALRQAMLEHCGVRDSDDCADCRCVYDACCAA